MNEKDNECFWGFLILDFEGIKMACTHFPGEDQKSILHLLVVVVVLISAAAAVVESAIGVNWGTIAVHKLPPSTVVDLLRENNIQKVKLFDADPAVLSALMGSGIEVMVGIPNDMLAAVSSSSSAADLWVAQNVTRYMVKGGVNIKYSPFFLSLYCSIVWVYNFLVLM